VFALFLTLMLIDGALLTVVVLLQSGKGGGLASMGGGMGTDNLIGGRQAATILTKTTWITGGLFLTFALVLAILSSRAVKPASILKDEFKPAAQQSAPPGPVQVPGATPAQTQPAQNPPAPATTTK
jgi:preprotein translocase subunit SecG